MLDFKTTEEEILKFWEKNKIYEKVKKKNSKGKKFYFMDGPPYANGSIHMGTALNKTLKDIAMRSRRLQGFDVFDRPGYDTHGVPIEFQVEKTIGSTCKQDIEKYGVKKFVGECKKFATKHIGVMNDQFKNLGVWMDWDNPYLTLDDEYIEAIWSAFKEADKKGLLYLGEYPVHVCPRCETAVAYNEIEYGKQRDTSVYVKFPLKDKKNTFLAIWTTTPWTLPANTGVMVHPEFIYQEVEVSEGERWIIAKELVPKLMADLERGFTVKHEIKGKDMKDWRYENPLAKNLKLNVENGYRVVLSNRYVTTEEGTGLVHVAPGHGKEDYEVGKENGLDVPSPVNINGTMTIEAGKYAGKKARVVDKEIIEDLEKDGFLIAKKEFEHDYPLCWRDKSPLLMMSRPQWFFKINDIKEKLLKENSTVDWVPDYMKLRMKAWLEGIGDWPVSRQRYWGSPLPIWLSEDGERIVVGSLDELKKLSGKKSFDIHKPDIDNIVIKKNGKEFRRVPEVLDVWFDSGVSSWAALGYPNDKKNFKKYWPADLNIEGKDQFRGWWNSQIILSEILFEKKPFDSISVHGMVIDIGKKKMSKSLGNFVSPEDVIKNYGRDYMRYYFAKLSRGDDFAYDEGEFKEIRKVITILANIDNYISQLKGKSGKVKVEDKWIISKFYSLVREVTNNYNGYKFYEALQNLEKFVMNDLSRTYIQITRDRADETEKVLKEIMDGLLILYAPIVPFLTEKMWKGKNSIHLSEWPEINAKKIDKKLEKEFEIAMQVVETGLKERNDVKIGLRWPLAKAEVITLNKISKEILDIIAQQLNVKFVKLEKGKESGIKVKLDTKMTRELEAEGFAREISRHVQSLRKKTGLQKGDLISLEIKSDEDGISLLKENEKFIKERTNSKKLSFVVDKNLGCENVLTIKEKRFSTHFL